MTSPRILWADDEIDLLRPHILFLENKGYAVTSVTNGADAVERVKNEIFEMVLLDEQMPGMDGLATLAEIKRHAPEMPVVMVTKSEEDDLMEEALGGQISDYLTKPVNPSQILLTCKRLLEASRLKSERASQDYLQAFNRISSQFMNQPTVNEWIDIYHQLVDFDMALEGDEGVRQVLEDQWREANRAFGRFVEDEYRDWVATDVSSGSRPALSHEVIPHFVLPELDEKGPVLFLVIDCMRHDQWIEFERLLAPLFTIEKYNHFSLLPTATPYSRNAIFSGLLPNELERSFPDLWAQGEEDEHSRNRNEETFLSRLLERKAPAARMRYEKIVTTQHGRDFSANIHEFLQNDLSAIVVNFVDILAHSRSDSAVLKEIAPDERAYRALTRTWFEHSWLFQAFQALAEKACTIIITSDHGAVRSLHPTKVIGDRKTSTALRYKYGRSLKCDERHAIFVAEPSDFALPGRGFNTNYIIAKEDYYFVYPTNYNHYVNLYRDTMQHGGASMEEMILPVIRMRPRNV